MKIKDMKCKDITCYNCPFQGNCDWVTETQLTFGENLEILKQELEKEYDKED